MKINISKRTLDNINKGNKKYFVAGVEDNFYGGTVQLYSKRDKYLKDIDVERTINVALNKLDESTKELAIKNYVALKKRFYVFRILKHTRNHY